MTDETPVLFDSWSGEPIAWQRIGDPILGEAWGRDGPIPYTRQLTPPEAVALYGDVTKLVVGVAGGFQMAVYGETSFTAGNLDPRKFPGLTVRAEIVENNPHLAKRCTKCNAGPGEECLTSNKRVRMHRDRLRWNEDQ